MQQNMHVKYAKRNVLLTGLLIVASCFPAGTFAQTAPSKLLDMSLVRLASDPKVYYLDHGVKRWIETGAAFSAQGFQWSDVTLVDSAQLATYADGPSITTVTSPVLPVEHALMPDLAPIAPYDLHLVKENGRTLLRFTAAFWNRGKGAFEMDANAPEIKPADDQTFTAFQKIYRPDKTFAQAPVGTLFWHAIHQHYHFQDFGEYVLDPAHPTTLGASINAAAVTSKTTFCMRDDLKIGAPSEGAKQPNTYGGCTGQRQGVSVGWADVYPSSLPDQFIDVTDVAPGNYRLSFKVDPEGHFSESRRDNNVSATLIQLDPGKMALKIIGTASPYEAATNNLPDGTLVQAEGDGKIFVVNHNKKRWIRNEEIFNAYGFAWNAINILPRGSVDAIPQETLIRLAGSGQIYSVNAAGFKRRILNPDVLASYGWTRTPVSDINKAEFDATPSTNLIMKAGDTQVFALDTKAFIGSFDQLTSLGFDPASVHIVNDTDFKSYGAGVVVVAQNLNVPWDIGFLPDGDMLVTERGGTVRRLGKHPVVMPVASVKQDGEGGLMGIAIDPNFSQNSLVYLYFTTTQEKNRIARFRLEGDALVPDKVLLDGIPSGIYHDGGQVEFGPDGKLYVTTGDATQPNLAQDLSSMAGKILRINSDGTIPSDNPFGNAIWSYGHRNPQGLAWSREGVLYATEHGPTGDLGQCCRDEVNRIDKGGNYGWPIITGDQRKAGMITPLLTSGAIDTWAPSGIAWLNGNLYFAGLRGSALYQTTPNLDGTLSALNTRLSGIYGRLRAIVLGPDGNLYVTTSNRDGRGTVHTGDDKILRINPTFLGRSL